VDIKGDWFMFGSEDHYDEGFLQAREKNENENTKMRVMREDIGEEKWPWEGR